ncbi:hypothetical protein OAQ99_06485, partial [Candidatus Kapabacteria bacterium]|nr:hypothetical protein [Candidatus Kapabacteria bacterium]
MKKTLLFLILVVAALDLYSQAGGLIIYESGDPDIDESAIFEIISQDKGVLIPRMTSQERNSIALPIPNSLLIFNTDLGYYQYYRLLSSTWVSLIPGELSVQGTGTVGQLAYWFGDGSSTFSGSSNTITGSADLFYDFNNTFLGVGTDSPSFTLDVNGLIRTGEANTADGGIIIENSNSGASAFLLSSSSMTSSATFILPESNGPAGGYLTTDGNGNLIWVDPANQDDFVVDVSELDPENTLAFYTGSNSISSSSISYDPNSGDVTFVGGITSSSLSTGDIVSTGSLSVTNIDASGYVTASSVTATDGY